MPISINGQEYYTPDEYERILDEKLNNKISDITTTTNNIPMQLFKNSSSTFCFGQYNIFIGICTSSSSSSSTSIQITDSSESTTMGTISVSYGDIFTMVRIGSTIYVKKISSSNITTQTISCGSTTPYVILKSTTGILVSDDTQNDTYTYIKDIEITK